MPDTLVRRLGYLSIVLGVASIALLAVSVWGFRAGGWPWPQAYDIAGWGAWAAGAGIIAALAGLVVWLRRRRGGAGAVLLGLILSLPVAGLGSAFEIAARTTPPINDISTDTEDPPVFWSTATPSDYPAKNAKQQRAAYPDVRPLDLPVSADEAFAAALALVEERGWEVLSADPVESQIEAIARSSLFGFEDEVAIRVTETDTGARIDMRSRSRLGQIDRGANARRIEAYLGDLDTRART
ncbi:DUF1499 domain-containing protein [Seohaeicola zhoushanensis]|uniref:DUF1499 domain-containing protein n=1 Tax=Seohaeicola zhoushanensis TaxID=1569283 RepID=A0A8J3MB49_9RHOB|nr:DUF1499 domain-containing protein [Seohaeicola zhoushanensis]GHF73104.1 hypothetical protein GCM10017056_49880 [Seohaeicola zhoushanensis]